MDRVLYSLWWQRVWSPRQQALPADQPGYNTVAVPSRVGIFAWQQIPRISRRRFPRPGETRCLPGVSMGMDSFSVHDHSTMLIAPAVEGHDAVMPIQRGA